MSETVFAGFALMLALGIVAASIQNAVFARALGVSRLLSLVDDTTSTAIFAFQLTAVALLGTLGHYYINELFLSKISFADYIRPLAVILCMSAAFLIVFFLSIKLTPYKHVATAVDTMPSAAFNVTVFATIMLTASSGLDLISSLVYAAGSSLGFILAVVLVTEGQRKLKNSNIPTAFKGLPVTLLYLAGLALAIYGLTGFTFGY